MVFENAVIIRDVRIMETKIERIIQEEEAFLECEKRWVFGVLMLVGGFFGGFTYTIRGGVFCNAQTANVVLFAIELARRNWSSAL